MPLSRQQSGRILQRRACAYSSRMPFCDMFKRRFGGLDLQFGGRSMRHSLPLDPRQAGASPSAATVSSAETLTRPPRQTKVKMHGLNRIPAALRPRSPLHSTPTSPTRSDKVLQNEVAGVPAPSVFDLDGTLVDTAPDLVASLNHAVTPSRYRAGDLCGPHASGRPRRTGHDRADFRASRRTIAEEELSWQMKEFVDFYHGSMPGESLPYPGLVEALDRLQDAG